ncbi:MAG: sigma-70 family RNA polymerase sigma factor, partial [Terracidiphilus sp.]
MDASGAREATIQAYQLHASALSAYAHQLTRNEGLAQDAVQETFLHLFLALMQGEDIKSTDRWLHRVAHNYICETQKSTTVRKAVSLDDAPEDRLRDDRASPESGRISEWVESARMVLAPREWECVHLRAEGFDYTEIAAELAI